MPSDDLRNNAEMRKTQLQKHISDPNRCFRKLRSSPRLCFARFFLINSIEGARRRREFHPPATRPLGQILTSPFSLYFIGSAPKEIAVRLARGLLASFAAEPAALYSPEPLLKETTRNDVQSN